MQRLGAGHRLVRIPAALRHPRAVLPGDGRIEAVKRIRQFDGEVGAARDHRAGIEQSAPGIAAFDALRADPVFRHVHVARRVHRLHGRDHAEFREARNIVQRNDLGVLDAVAQRRRLAALRPFEGVERHAVAEVADRVDADLESLAVRHPNEFVELLLRVKGEPAILRVVVIGLDHGCAAAAEGTVRVEFHGSNIEVIVPVTANGLGECVEVRTGVTQHRVDAHAEVAVIGHRHVYLGLDLVDSRIVDARDAQRQQAVDRSRIGVANLTSRRVGNVFLDERHRVVDQDARGLAVAVANDLAANRIRRVRIDPGNLQRLAVGPARMPVDTPQPDRPVRHRGVDVRCAREFLDRP